MHKLWQFLNFTILIKKKIDLGNHMERNEWIQHRNICKISYHRFYKAVLTFYRVKLDSFAMSEKRMILSDKNSLLFK